jgi:hypothetical protein
MRLSDATIAAVKETYGKYNPAEHDKLVQNIINKVSPFTTGVPVQRDITKILIDRMLRSRNQPLELGKIFTELAVAVVDIGTIAQNVTGQNTKQMFKDCLDKLWPTKPAVRSNDTVNGRSAEEKFVVRLYDGFDKVWIDVAGPMSRAEADKVWNEKTNNGKVKKDYNDIDYYKVFPV